MTTLHQIIKMTRTRHNSSRNIGNLSAIAKSLEKSFGVRLALDEKLETTLISVFYV